MIYHQAKSTDIALTRLAHRYGQVDRTGFSLFLELYRIITYNIVIFFKRRLSNAASESFNAKIKILGCCLEKLELSIFLFKLINICTLKNPLAFRFDPLKYLKKRRCLKRIPSFFVILPVYYPFLFLKHLWSSQLSLFEKSSYRNK